MIVLFTLGILDPTCALSLVARAQILTHILRVIPAGLLFMRAVITVLMLGILTVGSLIRVLAVLTMVEISLRETTIAQVVQIRMTGILVLLIRIIQGTIVQNLMVLRPEAHLEILILLRRKNPQIIRIKTAFRCLRGKVPENLRDPCVGTIMLMQNPTFLLLLLKDGIQNIRNPLRTHPIFMLLIQTAHIQQAQPRIMSKLSLHPNFTNKNQPILNRTPILNLQITANPHPIFLPLLILNLLLPRRLLIILVWHQLTLPH